MNERATETAAPTCSQESGGAYYFQSEPVASATGPAQTAAQLTAYLAALCEAVKAGAVQPRIANEVRIAVLETGEKPSFLLSITGGEPLSEGGQIACAFLERLGA